MNLNLQIEAILFSSEEPVSIAEIIAFYSRHNGIEYAEREIKNILEQSISKYNSLDLPFTLIEIGDGYIFKSKSEYYSTITEYLQRDQLKKLTGAALETLAIIAYKQPVTKSEIEEIRGVNTDYTIKKLLEKDLIKITGRSEEVGKPLIYGTTGFFLEYFGINNLDELPRLKEFVETENQIGEKESITH